MTIEKLQKVATIHVDASFQARWLRWWDSPVDVKTQSMFPFVLPLCEKVLDDWLHKASFWVQALKTIILLVFFSFQSLLILTYRLSVFSWRRVLRLRSPLLKMNARSILTELLRRMFCSLLISSSIGGWFFGARLSVFILTRRETWSLRKGLDLMEFEERPHSYHSLFFSLVESLFCVDWRY